MKWSAGPIVAQATVEGFRQIEGCAPEKPRDTTKGFQLHDLEEYWASRRRWSSVRRSFLPRSRALRTLGLRANPRKLDPRSRGQGRFNHYVYPFK